MKTKVIFISGIPSSGKTTISRLVAQKIGVDKIIDLDILKETCKTLIIKENSPYLFTTSHEAYKIENLSLVDGFICYANCIQNHLINLLNNLKNERYIIVEGAQLTPDILEKIDDKNFDCFYFYLILKNKKQLIKHINKKLKIRQGKWLENLNIILEIQKFLNNKQNQIFIKNTTVKHATKQILKELKNENFYS